jgi:hypothetical protein
MDEAESDIYNIIDKEHYEKSMILKKSETESAQMTSRKTIEDEEQKFNTEIQTLALDKRKILIINETKKINASSLQLINIIQGLNNEISAIVTQNEVYLNKDGGTYTANTFQEEAMRQIRDETTKLKEIPKELDKIIEEISKTNKKIKKQTKKFPIDIQLIIKSGLEVKEQLDLNKLKISDLTKNIEQNLQGKLSVLEEHPNLPKLTISFDDLNKKLQELQEFSTSNEETITKPKKRIQQQYLEFLCLFVVICLSKIDFSVFFI